MEFFDFIQSHNIEYLAYAAVALGMLLEGTVFLLAAVFLVARGVLNPVWTLIAALAGAFSEELIWYYIGSKLTDISRLSPWINKLVGGFDEHIRNKTLHTLIFSKFVYGIHRAVAARAGMLKVDFQKFLANAALAIIFWIAVIGGIAYVFNASFLKLEKYIRYVELVPLIVMVIFFSAAKVLSARLKKNL